MNSLSLYTIILTFLFLSTSCDRRTPTRTDTQSSGLIEIAVDESFAPIIQQQINVFESANSNATIIPIYTSELEAYRQLMDDSVRLLVGSRELTPNEKAKLTERNQRLHSLKLATDGIALIVNKANTDSLITTSNLKKILTGEVRSWADIYPNSKLGSIEISFDSPNSSMSRYMKDSICGGLPFGENITACAHDQSEIIDLREGKTANTKVIDYVANTPNAMGIVGVNWISNAKDTTNLSFLNKIRVMAVSRAEVATVKNSYKPYPYELALQTYPLTRDLYIIITDYQGFLPSGFFNFSTGDIGQRIITKSGILPATRPTRIIQVKTTWD